MGSMSCQNSLKMHFCSCDSGMSLILEVDVASATETTISILLLRDTKQPMAFTVWLLNLRWRCVDTSWINLWIQLLSLEKVVIRCADGWSVETQTSSEQNVCLDTCIHVYMYISTNILTCLLLVKNCHLVEKEQIYPVLTKSLNTKMSNSCMSENCLAFFPTRTY